MSIQPGTHKLGPSNATLSVKTGRTGAAAKAGHNLVIDVTEWDATVVGGDAPSFALTADSSSLRVRSGEGGLKPLGDDDKAEIEKTINKDILKKKAIEFQSTSVTANDDGSQLSVSGNLTLMGSKTEPITFKLAVRPDGKFTGSATVVQTNWGIKVYSAMFGALKVSDDIEVEIDASLPVA